MQVADVIATIDRERFAEIAARYGGTATDERREKYLDLELWLRIAIRRAKRVDLHLGPRRRVLDLGCGCGYFLYVCKLFGHKVIGIDIPEQESMYTEIRELLGVPWIAHRIKPFEPLPDVGRIDVMTAHMVTFNGHRSPNVWGPREWDCLIGDVPQVSLELNAEPTGLPYPNGVREHFAAQGARVHAQRVLIDRRV